jgi:hypothetical protein
MPPVADLAAGERHACARTHDGQVYCWGDNAHRQLGCSRSSEPACTDPANNEIHPIEVPDVEHASQLALGDEHSCVRTFDDAVMCWGERTNGSGQTGYGRHGWPEDWRATQVISGPTGSCAVMEDTTLRCWGDFTADTIERSEHGQTSYVLPELQGVITAAMGDRITCVRYGDSAVRCWLQ